MSNEKRRELTLYEMNYVSGGQILTPCESNIRVKLVNPDIDELNDDSTSLKVPPMRFAVRV